MPQLSPLVKLPAGYLAGVALSRNFTLDECIRSATADRLEIDNRPALEHVVALATTVNVVVQPVRDLMGNVIFQISSGYRCAELSKAVGSSETSRHTLGQALDIQVRDPAMYAELVRHLDERPFDGLIIERVGDRRWIHVSYDRRAASRGVRRYFDGKVYHPLDAGLHGEKLAAFVAEIMA